MTPIAEAQNIPAISSPTTISGQPDAVRVTIEPAMMTPAFPATSFNEHTHTERMLMSSWRRRHSMARHTVFAASARTPTVPIVSASGCSPCMSFVPTWTSTPTPKTAMISPFSSAARACHTGPRAAAYRLKP